MATKGKEKYCFVIGPIGAEGSPERTDADWLLRGIIEPVLKNDPFNYVVQRADQISQPGLITDQAIAAVIDADLAIADLTGANANAFYELAIRHMEQKAVIHMAKKGEPVPFDIKDYRAVFYSREHPDDLEEAKAALAKQVEAIEDPAYKPSNPITKARGVVELERSADSRDKVLADLIEGQRRLALRLSSIEPPRIGGPSGQAELIRSILADLEVWEGHRMGLERAAKEPNKFAGELMSAHVAAATETPPDKKGES